MTDQPNDSEKPLNDRLLVAKYLYTHGCDVLRDDGLFDPGLAVSLFQDSVEIVLRACGALVHAAPKDKIGFEPLWLEVSKALVAATKPELRMKIAMDDLNKVRVNFKHAGQVPDRRVAETCRIDAGEFLSWAMKAYFGKEFSSLSMVTFVIDQTEREHLQKALDSLTANDRRAALLQCAEALSRIHRRRTEFYRHGILVQHPNIDPTVRKYVNNEIIELRKQIWDVDALVFAQACGVSPADFVVVRQVLPQIRGCEAEFPVAVDWLTDDNVRRCVELLVQFSIGLSQRLRSPEKFFAAHGVI